MIGVYFFLLFARYTFSLFTFKAVEAGLDRFWRAMAFRQFIQNKNPKPGNLASLQCKLP